MPTEQGRTLINLILQGNIEASLEKKSKISGFNATNFISELIESQIFTSQELQFIHQFASHPEVFSNEFFTWKNGDLDFTLKQRANSSGEVIGLINFYLKSVY